MRACSAAGSMGPDRSSPAGADPLIRYVVDDEFGDIAHKDESFANRVMFWRGDETPTAPAGEDLSGPIDPAAEQARIDALTGGGEVVIRRESNSRIKLPGL